VCLTDRFEVSHRLKSPTKRREGIDLRGAQQLQRAAHSASSPVERSRQCGSCAREVSMLEELHQGTEQPPRPRLKVCQSVLARIHLLSERREINEETQL
jgi:hypothetical protein